MRTDSSTLPQGFQTPLDQAQADAHAHARWEKHQKRVLASVSMFMTMLYQSVETGLIEDGNDLFWQMEQGGLLGWASQLLVEVDAIYPSLESGDANKYLLFLEAEGFIQADGFVHFMRILGEGDASQIENLLFAPGC